MLSVFRNAFTQIANADESLVGRKIDNDPVIEGLVSDLVDEVVAHNSSIDSVRKPLPHLTEKSKSKIDRIGALRGRPLYHNYIGTGAGRGPYVELEDGSIKLDLINGIGIHLMGHSHPRIMKAAVRGALSDVVMQGNIQPNNEYLRLTEKLVQIAGRKSK